MPQVGDSLGRYTLLKRLALGGMGEVYLAAKAGPVGFGPRVALKILRPELARDQQFVDMLVDEANISMFLNHQNVVSVLDLAEDAGLYFLAMEFVQGVTLEKVIEKLLEADRRLDIPVSLYVASELCRALKYAHTRVNHAGEPLNIVHRDITPANILISIQGEVKLTDFGIARARGRIHNTQAGILKGKFGYMAPELIRYEEIDARADVFGAGVVTYMMLTGRHPVAGATVMEAIQRYEQKQVPIPSSINPVIPPSLDEIVMRALEPKPAERWGSAAALAGALQEAAQRHTVWRREVPEGPQRVVALLQGIVPEAFEDPVPADISARLLQDALAREGVAGAPRRNPTVPPTLLPGVNGVVPRGMPAGSADSGNEETLRPPAPAPPRPQRIPSAVSTAPTPPAPEEDGGDKTEALMLPSIGAPRSSPSAAGLAADLEAPRAAPPREVSLKKSNPKVLQPDTGDLVLECRIGGTGPTGAATATGVTDATAVTGPNSVFAAGLVLAPDGSGLASASVVEGFDAPNTDPQRERSDMMDEPALPAGSPAGDLPDDGRTRVSEEPPLPDGVRVAAAVDDGRTSLSPQPIDEGRTLVGYMPGPGTPEIVDPDPTFAEDGVPREPEDDAGNTIAAAMIEEMALPDGVQAAPADGADDGRTIAGMTLPDWDGAPSHPSVPVVLAPRSESDPDATRAYSAIDRATGGASGVPGAEGQDVRLDRSGSGSGAAARAPSGLAAPPAVAPPAVAPPAAVPPAVAPPPAAPPEAQDKSGETMLEGLDRPAEWTPKGLPKAMRTVADPRPEPPKPAAPAGPQLLQGPVRIVVNSEGKPKIGLPASSSAKGPDGAGSEPPKKKPLAIREKGRPAPAARTPSAVPPAGDGLPVGDGTNKWMAGQIGPQDLAWDDDAAARRAVATRRHQGSSAPAPAPLGAVPGAPVQHPSFVGPGTPYPAMVGGQLIPGVVVPAQGARDWLLWMVAAISAAVVGGLALAYFALSTSLLWPKLRITSDPPGANVLVDEVPAEHPTPVDVKIEPDKRHQVELRLEGYKAERREIGEGVNRGRNYTLPVALKRILPEWRVVPADASVYVNEQKVSLGASGRLVLSDLPAHGPITVRITAPDYDAWQQQFDRPGMVPESLDVVLKERRREEPPAAR